MGIKLHKEHGLNPTMPVCILCDKETGEIALLGAHYKEQAPRKMVCSIEPCEDCLNNLKEKKQVLLYEGYEKEITGNYIILNKSSLNELCPSNTINNIAIVHPTTFEQLLYLIEQSKEKSKKVFSKWIK